MVLLVIIVILSLSTCVKNRKKAGEKIKWDEIVLHEVLPKPHSDEGEIYENSDDELRIDLVKTSEKQYNDYISACKDMGFTVDSESSGSSYDAFNENGYKLHLSFYKSNEELSITLESPIKMDQLRWPSSDIAGLLPVPESTVGRTEWEADYGFVIYVGNTTKDDFNKYADACAENGFTVDYERGDKYYRADNVDGYHISIEFEGNNIMFVRIDAPDEAEESSAVNETQTPEETDEPPEETVTTPSEEPVQPVQGIRPEFKEAMDSYEVFFNEYVEFMTQYANSGNTVDMLSDYLDFMSRYAEAMTALDDIDQSELSAEELSYYMEVMNRINQKLLTVTY